LEAKSAEAIYIYPSIYLSIYIIEGNKKEMAGHVGVPNLWEEQKP
jgi:hypothetical protein